MLTTLADPRLALWQQRKIEQAIERLAEISDRICQRADTLTR